MNLREVNMKCGRFVVLIRQDSAETLKFKYGLTLGIGAIKIVVSTGVLERVVCAIKRPISCGARSSSMILT
jgi:hypothetical protein